MAELTMPVDLIWGEKDPWDPLADAERWHNTINCVHSLKTMPGVGPLPP